MRAFKMFFSEPHDNDPEGHQLQSKWIDHFGDLGMGVDAEKVIGVTIRDWMVTAVLGDLIEWVDCGDRFVLVRVNTARKVSVRVETRTVTDITVEVK